jgi:hypothetical protein
MSMRAVADDREHGVSARFLRARRMREEQGSEQDDAAECTFHGVPRAMGADHPIPPRRCAQPRGARAAHGSLLWRVPEKPRIRALAPI